MGGGGNTKRGGGWREGGREGWKGVVSGSVRQTDEIRKEQSGEKKRLGWVNLFFHASMFDFLINFVTSCRRKNFCNDGKSRVYRSPGIPLQKGIKIQSDSGNGKNGKRKREIDRT